MNIENEKRIEKNKLISQSKKETKMRRESMLCKTYNVKIQSNKLNSIQKEALERVFIEQKWYKNYILNWLNKNENNKLLKFDTKITEITHKDKNLNDIPVKIKYLSASQRQCLMSRMYSNIKTLHSLKIRGKQKPGKLKFSKEEKAIDLKQYGSTHKILSTKRIKIQGIPKSLTVNGLNQFINIPSSEIANARLLNTPTGYYVQFVVYIPKNCIAIKDKINEKIGIDFGCATSFTTSTGEKFDIKIQESERLKKLQRKLSKQAKGSKGWYKTCGSIRKMYKKQTNIKEDMANKFVAKIRQYNTVIIQDEQIANWHKNRHGKSVQHSILGRVKSRLKLLDNVIILDKTLPTTKLCTNCGIYHDELKLSDRVFRCECGVEMDRDIHAAKNMVWFYEYNVGVGRTNVKRVEMQALVNSQLAINQLMSMKPEGSTL